MRNLAFRLLPALALLLPAATRAAQIDVLPGEGGYALVTVQGEFRPGDDALFAQAVERLDRAVIAFDSPGGLLMAGIGMGNLIHARGFTTTVPDRRLCASACAIAWLGGGQRLLSPEARLGFHAAFTRQGGTPTTSASGNAVVGAYMAGLGLGYRAVIYATIAAPNEILWLERRQAEAVGIAFTPIAQPNASLGALRIGPLPKGQPGPVPAVHASPPPAPPQASPAPADPQPATEFHMIPGRMYRGATVVNGRFIPLPPGRWTEVGRAEWLGGLAGPNYRYVEVALVRAEEGPVDAILTIRTIDLANGRNVRSWGASSICAADPAAYDRLVVVNTDLHQECGIVRPEPVRAGGHGDSQVWPRIVALRDDQPGILPQTALMVGYHFAEDNRAVTLRYYFGVERPGAPRQPGIDPWDRASLQGRQAELAARATAWMGTYLATVRTSARTGRAASLPDF